ncbi:MULTISPECIES: copper amine oxidase N-terminal domain-containing protein [Paenibacillus]|uniref:copper amine oxidase N-terminal domain-containing protein n=1 Tax=Paenibacillus TaxID=44249 RepID=UPI000E3C31A8|nr:MULTISPECIES: copper amine oxidase N-terminal domain-containing protein [Paenibacillus]QDA26663.1 copper amine oxidase N-terminal domain-containing protein [Paenibacillus polymyxa]RFT94299.1 copper amine oxidase N-terminal domain-containing protein [Paenibacillus jamilae]RTZ33319.1 copper amine oxidase N-terminal domain-containing protein [Paenibacillus polymyxa]WDZ57755.1 copper amine oxidase N-terminal domain-containing protein [Paenibacillus polymyxa]
MNFISKIACISVLSLTLSAGAVWASSVHIIVNNLNIPSDDVYQSHGTTMVPLNAVQSLPEVSITWNNTTKTVIIDRSGKKTILKVGQKNITIGSKKITLPVDPTLRNGRVMVPLRFIADSSGAYVSWNQKSQTAYVAKASNEIKKKYTSDKLNVSRGAVIKLPKISNLKEFTPKGYENLNTDYYFPEGKSDSFFIQEMDVISFYKASNDHVELIWTARFDSTKKESNGLSFLPYKLLEQDGLRPTIQNRVAHFNFMSAIGEISYSVIDNNGKEITQGQKLVDPTNFFIAIPGEQK